MQEMHLVLPYTRMLRPAPTLSRLLISGGCHTSWN